MLKIVGFSFSLSWLVFLTVFLSLQVKSATLQISPCTLSTGHGFSQPFKPSRAGSVALESWGSLMLWEGQEHLCYPANTCLLKDHHFFLLVIPACKSFTWGNPVSGRLELSTGLSRHPNLNVILDIRADPVAVFCSELCWIPVETRGLGTVVVPAWLQGMFL